MIGIIDYDAGNMLSVYKALNYLGKECMITRDLKELKKADKIILPGVGSFGKAMDQLKKYELDKFIIDAVKEMKPLFGICLGMQLLFSGSEESSGVEGLSLLKGSIKRIPGSETIKVPHIGWNLLDIKENKSLFQGIQGPVYAYFVHSYYIKAADENIVAATTKHGVTIHASVENDNLSACQFHPEKSSDAGLVMLNNFAG